MEPGVRYSIHTQQYRATTVPLDLTVPVDPSGARSALLLCVMVVLITARMMMPHHIDMDCLLSPIDSGAGYHLSW